MEQTGTPLILTVEQTLELAKMLEETRWKHLQVMGRIYASNAVREQGKEHSEGVKICKDRLSTLLNMHNGEEPVQNIVKKLAAWTTPASSQ